VPVEPLAGKIVIDTNNYYRNETVTSRLAALFLVQIFPIFSLVTPCQPGASPASVQRRTFTTGC
jgi:hypothetical protein